MSAKQLEDFIRVIETAENLSKRPESSIWSYPTDVFTRTSSPRRHAPKPSPPPSVPRLWDPKISSELLSSSWGSRSSCKSTPGSTSNGTTTTTKSSKLTTVRSASTMTPESAKRNQPGQQPVILEERKDFNTLMNMQRHNRFARRQAKDLLSSMSPTNSPRPARKSTTSKSPSTGRKSASKSPSAKASISDTQSPKQHIPSPQSSKSKTPSSSPSKEKSVISPQKLSVTSTSSSIEEVFESPKETPALVSGDDKADNRKDEKVSPRKGLVRSVTIKPDEDTTKEDDLTEEPRRPLPQPRARPRNVNIKEKEVNVKETKKQLKKRPKSAPTPKKQPQQPQSVDLRSYSKSFKLLGLDIPSNRTEATKVETINMDIKTKEPTMRTRLKERTGSVSDLRQIVDSKHHMPKEDFGKIKTNLSNAIFEEWYFSKMQELAEKDRRAKEKAESEALSKELETEAKKKKAAVEYQKWLDGKQKQSKKMKAKAQSQCQIERLEERKAKNLKAEEEWKSKKADEHKKYLRLQRRLQKKQEQEAEKQRLKKEEAVKKFNAWQEEWQQKFKAKIAEGKKKKLDEIEASRAEAKEKKEAAELAFNAWKAKKKEERKKGSLAPAGNMQSTKKNAKVDKSERLEAAREAYENWLEYVENREIEERFAEEERVLRELWRPPWYPPGIADF